MSACLLMLSEISGTTSLVPRPGIQDSFQGSRGFKGLARVSLWVLHCTLHLSCLLLECSLLSYLFMPGHTHGPLIIVFIYPLSVAQALFSCYVFIYKESK